MSTRCWESTWNPRDVGNRLGIRRDAGNQLGIRRDTGNLRDTEDDLGIESERKKSVCVCDAVTEIKSTMEEDAFAT